MNDYRSKTFELLLPVFIKVILGLKLNLSQAQILAKSARAFQTHSNEAIFVYRNFIAKKLAIL